MCRAKEVTKQTAAVAAVVGVLLYIQIARIRLRLSPSLLSRCLLRWSSSPSDLILSVISGSSNHLLQSADALACVFEFESETEEGRKHSLSRLLSVSHH